MVSPTPDQPPAAMSLRDLGGGYLRQLVRAMAHADLVRLRAAEFAIAFATADGRSTAPVLVLGEAVPLRLDQAEAALAGLDFPVHADHDSLVRAPRSTVGKLMLRLTLPVAADGPAS